MLFSTLFTLEMLATNYTFSTFNLFSHLVCQLFNISALVCEWREVVNLKHMFFGIWCWTKQTLIFLLLLLSNDWKLWTWRGLTFFIDLWGFAWMIGQFFSIIFVFLWIKMLFICLRGKELFWAQLAVELILSTTFGA